MNAIAQAPAEPISGSQLDNRRVIAGLIDVAIVAVGAAVIMAAAGVLGESPSELGTPLIAVTVGWALYYYFACESGAGQTVGKRVMKIRVVRADGAPADMREIAVRTVLRVVDGLFFYLVGLIVMIVTGERRARLGDLAANTRIVSAEQAAPVAAAPVVEEQVSRVPIAESGPAFAPVAEVEPEPDPEPEAEAIELESPSLKELAADVAATAGSAPEPEEAESGEEPSAEAAPESRGKEADDEELSAEEPVTEEPAGEEPAAEAPAEEGAAQPAPEAEAPEAEAAEDQPVIEIVSEELDEAGGGPDEDAGAPDEDAQSEDEEDDRVSIKSVETVSAIDLVMEDSSKKS